MISDNVLIALIAGVPAAVASIAAAVVSVKQSNKASARTDEKVDANAGIIADKLGAVHEQVNGNLTVERARGDALAEQNASLRAELAVHNATTKRPKKGAP